MLITRYISKYRIDIWDRLRCIHAAFAALFFKYLFSKYAKTLKLSSSLLQDLNFWATVLFGHNGMVLVYTMAQH